MSITQLRLLTAAALAMGLSSPGAAGLAWDTLSRDRIPAGISWQGEFVAGLSWTDSLGKNVAVFSRSKQENDEGISVGLHAGGYRLVDGQPRRTWRIRDGIENCRLDLTAFFEAASLEITDLDGNGVGEVSFVYRLACNGGMDLVEEKLFLVEDGRKYPVRGGTELRDSGEHGAGHYDGPMQVDKAFNQAPASFRRFAEAKWRRFRRPTGW